MLEGGQRRVLGSFPVEKPGSGAEQAPQPTRRWERGHRCQDAPVSGLNQAPTMEKTAETSVALKKRHAELSL